MATPINSSSQNKEKPTLKTQVTNNQIITINQLPLEILTHIFSYGDQKDLCNWERVCTEWQLACKDNALWKGLIFRVFPHVKSLKGDNYREIYKARSKLSANIQNNIRTEKVITEPIQLGGLGRLYNCSDCQECKSLEGKLFVTTSTTIEIWHPERKVKEKSYEFTPLEGCLIDKDRICIRKHNPPEIVFLDSSTLEKKESLPLALPIRALHRENNYLALGTEDGHIQIWNLDSNDCLKTRKPHEEQVLLLFIKKSNVYSTGLDNPSTISIVDLAQESERSLKVGRRVDSLLVENGKIFVGCQKQIKVFDEKTHQCLMTLSVEQSYIPKLYLEGNILIAGTKVDYNYFGGQTEVWDLNTGKRLNLFPTFLLGFQEGKMYIPTRNNCIVEWDFNTPVTEMPESPALLQTLAGLGIVSEKDYSEKLQVRPSFLKDVGIKTPEDLQYLKITPVITPEELEAFKVEEISLPEANTLEELREQQNKLLEIRENAKASIDKLLGVVQRGMDVSNQLDVFLESTAKWENLRDDILGYKKSMDGLTRKELLNGGLKGIFEKITQQFKQVEKEHQVAILKAYLLQPGLLGTWTQLKNGGIDLLSELMNSSDKPANLFQMGEF